MIGIQHIRHVLVLNKHRNYAMAAKELHITQPALTRSIQTLEHLLGVKLFNRKKRSIEPTVYGKIILEQGDSLLFKLQRMEKDIALMKGLSIGMLTIGIEPASATNLVARAIAKLSDDYSGVDIRTVVQETATLQQQLVNGEVELFVADSSRIEVNTEFESIPLQHRKFMLICQKGHPLTHLSQLDFSYLFDYPIATSHGLSESLLVTIGQYLRQAEEHNNKKGRIHCDNSSLLLATVQNSLAVGFINYDVAYEIDTRRFDILDLNLSQQSQNVIVYLKHNILSPVAEAFIADLIGMDQNHDLSD